jgi:AcrR family transcriptional regulator
MSELASPRIRNKERRRAAILEAARAGFAANGIDGTTMDDIAAAARVSRATLFNYFSSKNELLDAMVVDVRNSFRLRIEYCCSISNIPAERIMLAFSGNAEALERGRRLWGVVVGRSELGWNDASIVERLDELATLFGRLLGSDLPGASAHQHERQLLAEMTLGAYLNMIHRWRFDEGYPLRARLIEVAEWIGWTLRERGLQPQASSSTRGTRKLARKNK